MERFDVAIVGAGVVGLAHALAAARNGAKVVVVDRSPRAVGASVRNFGMVWPIGQQPGPRLIRALRSRELWLECAQHAGFWVEPCGALHVAQQADELSVLEEFCAKHAAAGYGARMLSGDEACAACPALRRGAVIGAMRTTVELCVDPREAIRAIPAMLSHRFGVEFRFETMVLRAHSGAIECADGRSLRAERIIVCSGPDTDVLYPALLREAGVVRCKLQMMRTVPQPEGWRLASHLAAGLTLLHYPAFQSCTGLAALRARMEREYGEHLRAGVHVLVSQHASGHLVIGDSHEYGDCLEPFDRQRIDALILGYLRGFAELPRPEISERWHGVYAKCMDGRSEVVVRSQPGVFVVNGLGGMGMTLSMGLAEETIGSILADREWRVPEPAAR